MIANSPLALVGNGHDELVIEEFGPGADAAYQPSRCGICFATAQTLSIGAATAQSTAAPGGYAA
ncbi:hypothetical protein DMA15_22885 [Streptomyces sp. WAC 01529]|uniref:hypothetical protein n=1 Tax=Streptomyces sp. WAC 01529 TaxID=2203205 RepID=UPI000F6FEEB5|nr:hypothetical protein [Streptomyces sp. WAC 01529]AZM55061.1 hypothetical protein DMA15_22885 [Streptomyces sp. WAC 01529]